MTTLAAACADRATAPTEASVPLAARVDVTSRARFTFDDSVNVGTAAAPSWMPTGWRGDGRLRDGSPGAGAPSNEYQGSVCGVNAVIGSGAKGETSAFNSDPDMGWSAGLASTCGGPSRHYQLVVGTTAYVTHPHWIIGGLGAMLVVGDERRQPLHSGTLGELGFALWYDDAYPPSSNLRVTRLPNVVDQYGRSVRQWRVETTGSHLAVEVTQPSPRTPAAPTGRSFVVPLAMTVTEVPYPLP